MGGAFAGLVTAPLASALGWPTALLATVAVALLASLAIQPLKTSLDAERDPTRPLGLAVIFQRSTWLAPIAALRLHKALPPLTVLAMSLASLQGCLFTFTVTWLTVAQGLSLVQAGVAFACMQASGVVARIALGWLADCTGRPTRNLLVQAIVASLCALAFAAMPRGTSTLVINVMASVVGFVAVSWNGIYMAEVARLVPPEDVAAATSGSVLFTFLGYMLPPAIFAVLVSLSGSWSLAFSLVAAQLGVVSIGVIWALRRARAEGAGLRQGDRR